MMKNRYIVLIIIVLGSVNQVCGQLNPFHAQYFTNRYLGNPAMAGIEAGWEVSLAHRNQFIGMPGAPQSDNITLNYGGKRVGVGVYLSMEKAGLQNNLQALATYAYHFPVSDYDNLHFGLSLGVRTRRLNIDELIGDVNDPRAVAYNEREKHLDGDFGIAYTHKAFTLEAALPNLRNLVRKENVYITNLTTFYSAMSYKIGLEAGSELEHKLVYRGVKNMKNIWDAGAEISFVDKQLKMSSMYHSTNSISFGFLMDYRHKYLIGMSHTAQTSKLAQYSNGDFEIHLRIKWN